MPRRPYKPEPPIKGCIDVGDIYGRLRMLDVHCRNCGRFGRLSVERLMREHGPTTPLWKITGPLYQDCPKRTGANIYDLCRVECAQLAELFCRPRGDG